VLEPPLPSDSTITEKFLDRLKQERHVERPEDSLFSEPMSSEPIQESAAGAGEVEVTVGTITGEMIEAAGKLSPFPPTNWEVIRAMVLDPKNKDSEAKMRAIGNTARSSDTRNLPSWAESELMNLFGEIAENKFRDRLIRERSAPKWLDRSPEVSLQRQLSFKREVLEECRILYDEALAGIATAPFTFKAVESRAGESIVALLQVPEPNRTVAATEKDPSPTAKNTESPSEPEAAAAIPQNKASDGEAARGSKALDMFANQVVAPGSIPSQLRMGTPGLDVQRSFPPSRHSFTGGPVDPKQKADLDDEIGWLAREIQVLEGPPGLPPGDAIDRLLDCLTGQRAGEVDVDSALNELRKHCRASGVHRLETGEFDKAAAFEGFAVRIEGLQNRFGKASMVASPETLPDLLDPLKQDARPLGDNPFPPEHEAYALFEQATWEAKEAIAQVSLDFVVPYKTSGEVLQGVFKYRTGYFNIVAKQATCVVGNERMAEWYESWINDFAKIFLKDSLIQIKRKDPRTDPAAPPFYSPEDIATFEASLTFELMRIVTFYKKVAASNVLLINKARANAADTPPEPRVGDQSGALSNSPSTIASPLPVQHGTGDPAAPAESVPPFAEAQKSTRKGDIALLKKADGSLYRSVDFSTAEIYADISSRRRQQLMPEVLKVVGQGHNRRITVESLLAYCPPEEDTK
jgi:hypothetical protein